MTKTKIGIYTLIILTIILSLLISMLNLENSQEFVIAKWAICGILAVVAVSISLLDIRFFSKGDFYRLSLPLVIKVIATPLIVITLAAIFFVLTNRSDLLERIFFQAPLMPVLLVFLAPATVHLINAVLRRSKK